MSLVSLKLKTGIIAGCIAATIMGATGLQAWVDHRDTIINTEATVDNMARVVEAHIQATLTQARTVTDLISEMVIEDEGPQLMREASRWKKLRSLCQGLTGCKSIAIVDPDGQVVALTDLNSAPHIDASDRAYFQMPRETDKLYIGAAMVTRIEGSPILFPIAMPVRDNDGKLLAIVTIGMNTGHLTDFYGLLGFGGSATVAVIKSNGELVARYPDMKQYVGRHLKDSTLFNEHLPKSSRGVFHARSALDGRPRIAAYTSIKAHDLVVYVGMDAHAA